MKVARWRNSSRIDITPAHVDAKKLKPKKISEDRIQQLVADAGHDTDLYTATDEAYDGLEACCLYRTGCQGCSDREKHSDNDEDEDRR